MKKRKRSSGAGIGAWLLIGSVAGLAGCATGGSPGSQPTYMQACLENAKTEQDRSQCAWDNSARMAGGGR